MKGGTILLVVGLILGYLAVTGKYKCFTVFVQCIVSGSDGCSCGSQTAATTTEGATAPNPKTYTAPAYEGPGPISYNIPSMESFA
jgi:hypothetical protein